MKIFIICSKKFYDRVPEIQAGLERGGHEVTLPNSYEDTAAETRMLSLGTKEHAEWKSEMLRRSREVIDGVDAVLVLNFEKNGVKNYIGGATFLEMYDAFKMGKRIFMYNGIPEGILRDEIAGFSPVVIGGDIGMIESTNKANA